MPAAQIKDIEVEWISGKVLIQPGETDSISFYEEMYADNSKQMIWKQSGDKLIIQFSQPDWGIFHFQNTYSKDLILTVPKQWFGDEVSIENVSSTIEINGLTCNEMEINSVSGKCSFRDCNVNAFNLETVSGGVDYQGQLKTLDCESVSGDCKVLVTNYPDYINLEGVSCDLTLYLPEDCGFISSMETASGDYTTDFPANYENGKMVFGDGRCKVKISSISGDMIIRKAT